MTDKSSLWQEYECEQLFEQISTTHKKVKTQDCSDYGTYPVVDQGSKLIAGYIDDETKVIKIDLPVCIFGDHTRVVKWIDFDFVPGADGTKILRPKEFLHPRFFYYLLNSIEIESKGYARHFKQLKSASVKVPSKVMQVRLADKLDVVFAKLEMTQSRLDKVPQLLKRFRMSVLSAAVAGELTEEWRDANPSLEAVLSNNFIQSYNGMSLDDLPQGWGWVSFKNAAKIESNLVDPKLTPSDIHLAPNHIEPNTGRILELVTVEQDKVKSNKHRFYPGQIIYSKIRPYLNKVCAVDFEGVCSADMYPVKANINREYLRVRS